MKIIAGARASNLSRAQVSEIFELVKRLNHEIVFETHFFSTWGDRDQKTSLRLMEKNDFFTRDLDEALLQKTIDIAIHSAKDLPEPLPKGLEIIALTKSIDSSDVIVLKKGLDSLPKAPHIGSSSKRRDAMVLKKWPKASCVDLRGSIEKRLKRLDKSSLDGVVMANIALLRLKIQRETLPLEGETPPLQGSLAVLALEGRAELKNIFHKLNHVDTLYRS